MKSLTRTFARAGFAASLLVFALGAQAQTTLRSVTPTTRARSLRSVRGVRRQRDEEVQRPAHGARVPVRAARQGGRPRAAGESSEAHSTSRPVDAASSTLVRLSRCPARRSCGATGRRPRRSSGVRRWMRSSTSFATSTTSCRCRRFWYWGWRNFTFTTKEVRKPEDMAGLRSGCRSRRCGSRWVRGFGASRRRSVRRGVYGTPAEDRRRPGEPDPTIYARKFYEVQAT